MAGAWHCPTCNLRKLPAGLRFSEIGRTPYCEFRSPMEAVDAAYLPTLWYRRGRFHRVTEALLEFLDLEDEAASTDMPQNLPGPGPGHPYRLEWERGRMDGYRERGVHSIHPDDWTKIT
jgi:hypothetical protein